MCTDKWRNLLEEYKKAKQTCGNNGASAKMSYHQHIEDIVRTRTKHAASAFKNPNSSSSSSPKVDPFLHFSDKDAVIGDGVPPSFWREAPGDGDDTHSHGGRVISVKLGNYTKRVGIDGSSDAVKKALKSAFGIRTKRAFWLEDEYEIVRSLDRNMPLGSCALHLDEGKFLFYKVTGSFITIVPPAHGFLQCC